MKKFLILSLILVAITNTLGFNLNYANAAVQQDGIKVFYNGSKLAFDVNPYVENGRTLVPFRKILEAFGAQVGWDEKQQIVKAKNKSTELFLKIGENYAYVNSDRVDLDTPPKTKEGRTFVPLRFISESLGAEVKWDEKASTVNILLNDAELKLGQSGTYKDIKFSIDKAYEEEGSGKLKVIGKVNVDTPVIAEVSDDYGYVLPGDMKVIKKEGDLYIVETEIYLPTCHDFEGKYIVLKVRNNEQKLIKIAEYIL